MARELHPTGGVPMRDRLEWLTAVQGAVEARELSCTAFMLAYVIALVYLNGQSGVAWPTQQTLGRRMALGERQVRALLRDLEAARFIRRTSLGKRRPDQIRLRMDRVKRVAVGDQESRYRGWLGLG